MTTAYDAIVLAGGAARRLGGVDKPQVRVGGRALLDRVLGGCRGAGRTVVVGSRRETVRPVEWAGEEPPGGGPLAALGAGVRAVTAGTVLVLSADLPFLDEETGHRLLDALAETPAAGTSGPEAPDDRNSQAPGDRNAPDAPRPDDAPRPGAPHAGSAEAAVPAEAAVLVDSEGRDQPLVAAYRTEPLRREIALIAAEHGTLTGLPLRLLTRRLRTVRVTAEPLASFDCDTWEDIATARARIREHGNVLDEWITAVKDELGLEIDVDTGVLLDLARDAAHGVARPAAPLTTFLVGYAAAQAAAGGEGGSQAVAEAARKAAALAHRWAAEAEQDSAG
ncbi:DUF6457 domain-containing protein [Streptomyces sp. NPDC006551]|uniref:DUF6457 domain-containing protein n=1 Tax=Streptomyces sp. NPDC006551 TaxID=3157178 RepID=UPI0033A58034